MPLFGLFKNLELLQGLNGILADEMGLGKTVQAMAFLSHLAEVGEFVCQPKAIFPLALNYYFIPCMIYLTDLSMLFFELNLFLFFPPVIISVNFRIEYIIL